MYIKEYSYGDDNQMFLKSKKGISGIDIGIAAIGVLGVGLGIVKGVTSGLTNLTTLETLVLGFVGIVLIAGFIRMVGKAKLSN